MSIDKTIESNKTGMECPVDFVLINENKARVTAFFVLILGIIYLFTGFWLVIAFLVVDFLLRTVDLGKYSSLGLLSDAVVKQLNIKNKPVDRGPKKFAAAVGLAFSASILMLYFLHLFTAAMAMATVLVFFAFLEFFFAFCAGCHVYSIGKTIIAKLKSISRQ
jgi:hypothetical protein